MNVNIVSYTQGAGELAGKGPEDIMLYCARVSSSRKDKLSNPHGLLRHCIREGHWSVFEQANVGIEIICRKSIAIQLIRHRSFSFQEFSMRYQDVGLHGDMFQQIELRKQATDNRQSSTEAFDPLIDVRGRGLYPPDVTHARAGAVIEKHMDNCDWLYRSLLDTGAARECSRDVLPLATTTKLYMNGTFRSWMHFINIRDDVHAQLEAQEIAKEVKKQLVGLAPITMKAYLSYYKPTMDELSEKLGFESWVNLYSEWPQLNKHTQTAIKEVFALSKVPFTLAA